MAAVHSLTKFEFVKVAQNQLLVVVPEKIGAMQKLIMQNCPATYCEIEVEVICSHWIPHHLTKSQKDARVDWCTQMRKKHNGGDSRDVYKYKIVEGDESWIYAYELERKQQSSM
ncbi:uncharacterized protein LOC119675006 [Teleopsis dalmanni]|uniref:uncharacterized protein LOC119675006 n=1 Tax=Teleopsis dalmanni TaxID=139649 RepID=UPI0018CCB63D|nr:uncharacterized protein LOC119675006 [Teleopsis dalmanni]